MGKGMGAKMREGSLVGSLTGKLDGFAEALMGDEINGGVKEFFWGTLPYVGLCLFTANLFRYLLVDQEYNQSFPTDKVNLLNSKSILVLSTEAISTIGFTLSLMVGFRSNLMFKRWWTARQKVGACCTSLVKLATRIGAIANNAEAQSEMDAHNRRQLLASTQPILLAHFGLVTSHLRRFEVSGLLLKILSKASMGMIETEEEEFAEEKELMMKELEESESLASKRDLDDQGEQPASTKLSHEQVQYLATVKCPPHTVFDKWICQAGVIGHDTGCLTDTQCQDICTLSQDVLAACIGADAIITTQVPAIYDFVAMASLIIYMGLLVPMHIAFKWHSNEVQMRIVMNAAHAAALKADPAYIYSLYAVGSREMIFVNAFFNLLLITAAMMLFGINAVASDMKEPFGAGPYDLPLDAMITGTKLNIAKALAPCVHTRTGAPSFMKPQPERVEFARARAERRAREGTTAPAAMCEGGRLPRTSYWLATMGSPGCEGGADAARAWGGEGLLSGA